MSDRNIPTDRVNTEEILLKTLRAQGVDGRLARALCHCADVMAEIASHSKSHWENTRANAACHILADAMGLEKKS
jgi:hypothetical protein